MGTIYDAATSYDSEFAYGYGWTTPHDWKVGEMAGAETVTGTVDMNAQIYGNMVWLGGGTVGGHDHSGGTYGTAALGPVSYMDFVSDGVAATSGTSGTLGGTVQRLYGSGTAFYIWNGTAITYLIANGTHDH